MSRPVHADVLERFAIGLAALWRIPELWQNRFHRHFRFALLYSTMQFRRQTHYCRYFVREGAIGTHSEEHVEDTKPMQDF
jgi:hypothetical protein